MSISLLQHTQGITGYEHRKFEYCKGELIIHIARKKQVYLFKLPQPQCDSHSGWHPSNPDIANGDKKDHNLNFDASSSLS